MRVTQDFTGKVALVTGAASGIGLACTQGLLRKGAAVVAADIAPATQTSDAARLRHLRVDVTQEASVHAMIDETIDAFGRLDIVVNSAGAGPRHWTPLHSVLEADWDQVMDLNVKGVWLCMKHAWPVLTRPGGVIVNIASVSGIMGDPNCGALSPSKHAVIGLTRTAAVEGRDDGFRVNAVSPGMVDSPARHESPLELAAIRAREPYGRLIAVEEVAAAVEYLVSDAAAYVNGANLVIDGGLTTSIPQ